MTAMPLSEATGNLPWQACAENLANVAASSPETPTTLAPSASKRGIASAKAWASIEQSTEYAAGKKYSTTGPLASAAASENRNGLPASAASAVKSGALSPTSSAARADSAPASPTASNPASTVIRTLFLSLSLAIIAILRLLRSLRLASAAADDRSCQSGPGRHARRGAAPLAAIAAALLLGACGTLPQPVARMPSAALPADAATALGRIAQASQPSPELSGFRLMPLGAYSLDARIQLADRAEKSLDVQYYVIENDATGRLLLARLRDAAGRGVRVRLLVDDLYTGRTDTLLRLLAAHPNVEVRLFNPFCCARSSGLVGRFASSLGDFGRLNHRMHNKLFIADGAMAVAGGRNIADEYFMRSAAQNFVDMDAFIAGAVVAPLAAIFDSYWNSDEVFPIGALRAAETPFAAEIAGRTPRQRFADLVDAQPMAAMALPDVDALGYGPIAEDLDAGRLGLVWGPARAYADPPDKLRRMTRGEAVTASLSSDALMTLWRAREELVITSPYLIPGRMGADAIDGLRRNDVKVTILTNSLAATDEPLVHNGYVRYRHAMLKSGVDLYELSPERTRHATRLGMFGASIGRLHAKTAVVDRRTVFVGSMNLDPRSASQNTELGVFIDSPQLAAEMLRVINISKLQSAYRLRLGKDSGAVEWLTVDDGREVVLTAEPESSWRLRLHNFIFGWFVPEQLL